MLPGTTYENLNGRGGSAALEIGIHPLEGDHVMVFFAGHGTGVNGFLGRYRRIANRLVRRGVGAVVHSSDPRGSVDDLRRVLDYVNEHAEEITGRRNPEIWLMGDSAGASAAASVATEYKVTKLLLLGLPHAHDLRRYRGELRVAIGSRDVFGTATSLETVASARQASRSEFQVVPGASHGFHGPLANIRFGRAFGWAFAGDQGFPKLRTRRAARPASELR